MASKSKIEERKDFKQENLSENNKKEVKMAYYCKLCRLWHYPGSAIYYAHKRYASKRPKARKVVKRKKKSLRKLL